MVACAIALDALIVWTVKNATGDDSGFKAVMGYILIYICISLGLDLTQIVRPLGGLKAIFSNDMENKQAEFLAGRGPALLSTAIIAATLILNLTVGTIKTVFIWLIAIEVWLAIPIVLIYIFIGKRKITGKIYDAMKKEAEDIMTRYAPQE